MIQLHDGLKVQYYKRKKDIPRKHSNIFCLMDCYARNMAFGPQHVRTVAHYSSEVQNLH